MKTNANELMGRLLDALGDDAKRAGAAYAVIEEMGLVRRKSVTWPARVYGPALAHSVQRARKRARDRAKGAFLARSAPHP
jgi:hypothetical protein